MFENNSQPFRQNILASSHAALGAEMLCWNHMLVPACYNGGIHPEHLSIRTKAGLTDMSGINKVWLSGEEAFEFLNHILIKNKLPRNRSLDYFITNLFNKFIKI